MIHAVIMAGGKGTRFWPLSRELKPKQFLSIITQHSLLMETVLRVHPLIKKENVWVVGSEFHRQGLAALKEAMPVDQILYEPIGKNTAACIGWAAMQLLKKDPDAVMVVLPSDHYISSSSAFRKVISQAAKLAFSKACLVTIGIRPSFPHVGYGYIEVQDVQASPGKVLAFHEKPSMHQAQAYIKSGRFFWNSGIFVWKAQTIVDMISNYMPAHRKVMDQLATFSGDTRSSEFAALYAQFESISIDYGVMEKSVKDTFLLPATFDWSDIGSWGALEGFLPRDKYGNSVRGRCIPLDSTGNIVFSEHKKVTLVDVHDMVVVDTPDAILVMPKNSDQKIKLLVDMLPPELK